jgi:ComF family protein
LTCPPSKSPHRTPVDLASTLLGGLADIIWPPHCLVCGALHTFPLCPACLARIERIEPPVCRACGLPAEDVGTCRWCRDTVHVFRCARAAASYSGVMEDAIRLLKFSGRRSLVPILGELMYDLAQTSKVLSNREFDLVVPVPMHPADVLQREFNQSDLLAHDLARRIGVECRSDAIKKIRRTKPQVGLTAQERRENLLDAFAPADGEALGGKSILLVDDVMTTGATADECARVLLGAGATSVCVITAARQV